MLPYYARNNAKFDFFKKYPQYGYGLKLDNIFVYENTMAIFAYEYGGLLPCNYDTYLQSVKPLQDDNIPYIVISENIIKKEFYVISSNSELLQTILNLVNFSEQVSEYTIVISSKFDEEGISTNASLLHRVFGLGLVENPVKIFQSGTHLKIKDNVILHIEDDNLWFTDDNEQVITYTYDPHYNKYGMSTLALLLTNKPFI